MLWPHTKTSVFFDKHQENAPTRIANRKFLTGCHYLLPSKTQYSVITWNAKNIHLQGTNLLKLCALRNTQYLLLYRKTTDISHFRGQKLQNLTIIFIPEKLPCRQEKISRFLKDGPDITVFLLSVSNSIYLFLRLSCKRS